MFVIRSHLDGETFENDYSSTYTHSKHILLLHSEGMLVVQKEGQTRCLEYQKETPVSLPTSFKLVVLEQEE